MPTRDTLFQFENYTKDSWQFWGNRVADENYGRRLSSGDSECSLRNILVSVVATDNTTGLMLEMQSAKFFAYGLRLSLVAVTLVYINFV